jgi:HSP20 family protein
MTALAHRDVPTLFNELLSWMGNTSAEPDIRIEEYVEDGRRIIRADLPGVDPAKDIRLEIDGAALPLRGERRTEKHEEHRSEIRYGTFDRVVGLPPGTRPDDVTAEYADGVLTVTMPTQGTQSTHVVPVTYRESAEG